jgi:hypothetical protein
MAFSGPRFMASLDLLLSNNGGKITRSEESYTSLM